MIVSPSASVAAIKMFSVAVTLASSNTISAPMSRVLEKVIGLVDFDVDTKGGESMKVGIEAAASDYITSWRMNGVALPCRAVIEPAMRMDVRTRAQRSASSSVC